MPVIEDDSNFGGPPGAARCHSFLRGRARVMRIRFLNLPTASRTVDWQVHLRPSFSHSLSIRRRQARLDDCKGAGIVPGRLGSTRVPQRFTRHAHFIASRAGVTLTMEVSLRVLATPSADTAGTSFYLMFADRRYLFGRVFEGLQRVAVEQSARVTKVTDIFITGTMNWETTGGLVGGIMSILDTQRAAATDNPQASVVSPQLNVHGGKNLRHTVASARRFVFRKGVPLHLNEYTTEGRLGIGREPQGAIDPSFRDENIMVWPMAVRSGGSSDPSLRRRQHGLEQAELESSSSATGSTRQADDEIRRHVVMNMFNSTWSTADMTEQPLREVRMPAQVFAKDEQGNLHLYDGPLPADGAYDESTHGMRRVWVRKPWPGANVQTLPSTSRSDESVSYIVKTYPKRGVFSEQQAKILKIPFGPIRRELALGRSITLADGKEITSSMVLGPTRPGSGFALLDIPSKAYLDGLLDMAEFKDASVMSGIVTVFWQLGPGLHQDSRIRNWIKEYPHINHLFSSSDTCTDCISFTTSAARGAILSEIDPAIFPPLISELLPVDLKNYVPETGTNVTPAVIAPKWTQGFGKSNRIDVSAVATKGHVPSIKDRAWEKFSALAKNAKEEWERSENLVVIEKVQQDLPGKECEIVTLGTGSMAPSLHRNVSGNLVRVPGVGSYLFDCGENTLGTLRRLYTPAQLAEIFHDLRCIWISHHHADHHLGLISVLKAWNDTVQTPSFSDMASSVGNGSGAADLQSSPRRLAVISGAAMFQFFKEYDQVEDFGFNSFLSLVPHSATPSTGWKGHLQVYHGDACLDGDPEGKRIALLKSLGLKDLQCVAVDHCAGARAVSMTFANGFKVSYSGDCRPCPDFAIIGRDSTVLIHEATFDDELVEDALAKKHSTTSEALGIARDMRARRVILTHFSQRYPKLPKMENVGASRVEGWENPDEIRLDDSGEDQGQDHGGEHKEEEEEMKVAVAFDGMRIKVKDIIKMDRFTPALQALFDSEAKKEEAEVET